MRAPRLVAQSPAATSPARTRKPAPNHTTARRSRSARRIAGGAALGLVLSALSVISGASAATAATRRRSPSPARVSRSSSASHRA